MIHNRILVALSLTDGRDAAFARALSMALTSGAELYLLHAVPANQPFSFRAAERRQRMEAYRIRAHAAGVNVVSAEQHGDPAEIVVLHADARPVDLIVMGTERRSGWARLRRPSVAEHVMRRTKRPTLIVPRQDTAAAFKKILVAVDLSPASGTLIETTTQLLGSSPGQLTAIHAVDSMQAVDESRTRVRRLVPGFRPYMLGKARQQLKVLVGGDGGGRGPALRVVAGAAAESIRAHAAYVEADLIVTGRTKRFLHMGSTAVRLLRGGDRALLVIPPMATSQPVGSIAGEPVMHDRAA